MAQTPPGSDPKYRCPRGLQLAAKEGPWRGASAVGYFYAQSVRTPPAPACDTGKGDCDRGEDSGDRVWVRKGPTGDAHSRFGSSASHHLQSLDHSETNPRFARQERTLNIARPVDQAGDWWEDAWLGKLAGGGEKP